jgi:hypothetical protein
METDFINKNTATLLREAAVFLFINYTILCPHQSYSISATYNSTVIKIIIQRLITLNLWKTNKNLHSTTEFAILQYVRS